MEYGLIGNPLKHSFSKEIHNCIGKYKYELLELSEKDLGDFLKSKDFKGINVTIPYKMKVMPYLDYVDKVAKDIGAVNTIVNKDGLLYGYNTDYLGFDATLKYNNVNLENKNVLILGTGATSKTVNYVCKMNKAANIYHASRHQDNKTISYDNLDKLYKTIDVIINTTPVGMYPHIDDNLLVDLSCFSHLECVIDVIFNPLRTRLLIEASKLHIKAINGLYMLVMQAIYAANLFGIYKENEMINKRIYHKILKEKQNIVLIGMPSCGKSKLGVRLASSLRCNFYDLDYQIEKKIKMEIKDYIKQYGEAKFREIEKEIIEKFRTKKGAVIATGGGAILDPINVINLKYNGVLIFLNRSLNKLKATKSRPLSSSPELLKEKYETRLPLYKASADIEINADKEIEEKIIEIKEIINEIKAY